jgi:hypothetical protein
LTTAPPRRSCGSCPTTRITKAKDAGWDQLANGELLSAAEQAGFDILLTADQSIRYQQTSLAVPLPWLC